MSLLPPPCDELTTSEPLRSATRVRPPGTIVHPLAVQHVGPQVDVPRLDAVVDEAGRARERQRRLRDVVARVGEDLRRGTPRARAAVLCGPISMP